MTRSLHRRLDAIEKSLPPDRIVELERLAAHAAIERRIDAWSAGRKDFEVLMAGTINDARSELIEAAVRHRVQRWRSGPPVVDEWRPHLLAAAAVDYAPGGPEQRAAITALEELAQPRDEPVWEWVDPWDSDWFEANRYLVVIGEDQGASLHEAAAETMASARKIWLEGRDHLSFGRLPAADPHPARIEIDVISGDVGQLRRAAGRLGQRPDRRPSRSCQRPLRHGPAERNLVVCQRSCAEAGPGRKHQVQSRITVDDPRPSRSSWLSAASRSTTSRCIGGCSASRRCSSTQPDPVATRSGTAGSWTRPT